MFLFLFVAFVSFGWAEEDIVEKSITIIERDYLWVEDLVSKEALIWAAEAAEETIPWLIVEPTEEGIHLRHGEKGEFAFPFSATL